MSKQTAMTRDKAPAPMRWLREQGMITDNTLDYGCGRRTFYYMEGWDPEWKQNGNILKEWQDIYCGYVLNTLTVEEEAMVLMKINQILKPGGCAYIVVRRDLPLEGRQGRGCWQRYVRLNLPVVYEKNGNYIIYRWRKKDLASTPSIDRMEDL